MLTGPPGFPFWIRKFPAIKNSGNSNYQKAISFGATKLEAYYNVSSSSTTAVIRILKVQ